MKKPVKIIMLPTEDNTNVGLFENKRLGYIPSMHNNTDWNFVDKNWKRQHLYVTVEQDVERVKEDDWWIYLGKDLEELKTNDIRQCKTELQQKILLKYNCRKIVATTDFKLTKSSNWIEANVQGHWECTNCGGWTELIEDRKCNCNPISKIQQSFLKEYVNNPSGKWEVEYNKLSPSGTMEFYDNLKLNQDNTVNISAVEEPKTKFDYDDVTHAIAYGYAARRQGLSHHDCLVNYKKANNIQYVKEEKMYSREDIEDMLFDISSELCWDDKDEDELIKACKFKIKEIKEKL